MNMPQLKEIDSLEVFVLMDNVSDPFTKNDLGIYWNESQYRFGVRGQREVCGADYCRACNGLSLFIRIKTTTNAFTLLFDTGPDAGLAVENAKKLGLDLNEVEAIVLSHGHFDHYGGTLSVLDAIGKKGLPVYSHPDLFTPRAFGKEQNKVVVSFNLTANLVAQHGGRVVETAEPLAILDGFAMVSGEVPRVTSYEQGFPGEYKLKENHWQCAPNVVDERCLIFNVKDKGLCVITGCGHTGIVNAAKYATELLNIDKVYAVIGGFHLAGSDFADRITPTIKDLQNIDPQLLITGHCTGRHTQAELSKVFENRHIPYGVGSVFKL